MFRNSSRFIKRSVIGRFGNGVYASKRSFETSAPRPSMFRQIASDPSFKTTLLLVIFGSQVINIMRAEKVHDEQEHRYSVKIRVLKDIVAKLKNGEKVDVNEELKVVNNIFKNSGREVTDIEIDETLNEFLKFPEVEVVDNAKIIDPRADVQHTESDLLTERHVIPKEAGGLEKGSKNTAIPRFL